MKVMGGTEKLFEKQEEFALSLESLRNNFILRPVRVNWPHTVVDDTAGIRGSS